MSKLLTIDWKVDLAIPYFSQFGAAENHHPIIHGDSNRRGTAQEQQQRARSLPWNEEPSHTPHSRASHHTAVAALQLGNPENMRALGPHLCGTAGWYMLEEFLKKAGALDLPAESGMADLAHQTLECEAIGTWTDSDNQTHFSPLRYSYFAKKLGDRWYKAGLTEVEVKPRYGTTPLASRTENPDSFYRNGLNLFSEPNKQGELAMTLEQTKKPLTIEEVIAELKAGGLCLLSVGNSITYHGAQDQYLTPKGNPIQPVKGGHLIVPTGYGEDGDGNTYLRYHDPSGLLGHAENVVIGVADFRPYFGEKGVVITAPTLSAAAKNSP